MTEEYAAARYEDACQLLPARLRSAALALSRREKAGAEELRLRAGRAMCLTMPDGARALSETRVTRGDLEQVLDKVTDYSRYAAAETIRRGYVTAPGGFRVGVCGTALPEGDDNLGIKDVSSLAIRIPRLCEGPAGAAGASGGRQADEHPASFPARRRQDHAAAGSGAAAEPGE